MKENPVAPPRRAEGALLERRGRRSVLRSADGSTVLVVNDSAAALFELCDGITTIDEMVAAICELSSIPAERAREDVVRAIDELATAGLVTFER